MRFLYVVLIFMINICAVKGQEPELMQVIKGTIADGESKKVLPGASISIEGFGKGAVADSTGRFKIAEVPVGRHTLIISFAGYESRIIPEVLVTSGKEVVLTVFLTEEIRQLKTITITGKRNRQKSSNEFAVTSARSFTVEDTKRYAAGLFDPARMVQNFAGVSNNGDLSNEIIVRGNSTKGVLWRLEGIEIPNPNHFSALGNTGGGISMLSTSTMGNSDFYTGAFPVEMGNALSAVFDLNLRNGNTEKKEFSFMTGALGIEASAEGPMGKRGRASYLVNYRFSTLSLLKGFIKNLGDQIPTYQDLSFKLNYPTARAGVFSLWGIGGLNKTGIEPAKDSTKWDEDDDNLQFKEQGRKGVAGISHQYFLNSHSFIKTIINASIDQTTSKSDSLNKYLAYKKEDIGSESYIDKAIRFSFQYSNKINARHSLRTGLVLQYLLSDYNNQFYNRDSLAWKSFLTTSGTSLFQQFYFQYKYRIASNLSLVSGIHGSYFQLNKDWSVEPRIAVQFQGSHSQTINISAGLHTKPEHLSTYLIDSKTPDGNVVLNKRLRLSKAAHFVAGYEKAFKNSFRVKAELYFQLLYAIPVEEYQGSAFSILNTSDTYDLFDRYPLVNQGKGRNYGIDISFEKPFADNFYLLTTLSIFKSEYMTYNKEWYNTRLNRDYQFNIVAGKEWVRGKKKNKILGINGKILTSGGQRYSPIDLEKSRAENRVVPVPGRYFTEKALAYFRVDGGFSYRVNRKRSSRSLSIDLQNITNRDNEHSKIYDIKTGQIKTLYQTGFIPNINYRIEF